MRDLSGYLCLGADGGVFTFGDAPFHGAAATTVETGPATAMAMRRDGGGYWIATAGGRVLAMGGAADHVGEDGVPTSAEVVDVLAPTDDGLIVLDAAGGVFCYGSAAFCGSVPGLGDVGAIRATSITLTSTGDGYWVLDHLGGVFCFGDARYHGSLPEEGVAPEGLAVALLAEPSGEGYLIVSSAGGLHRYGRLSGLAFVDDAAVAARRPVTAAMWSPTGALLVDEAGVLHPLGDAVFLGSPVVHRPSSRIVDIVGCRLSA